MLQISVTAMLEQSGERSAGHLLFRRAVGSVVVNDRRRIYDSEQLGDGCLDCLRDSVDLTETVPRGLRRRLQNPSRRPAPPGGPLQQLRRFDVESLCYTPHDPQARVEHALFELAQIASADPGLISKVVLRKVSFVPKPPQIGSKSVPQVHAGNQPNCSKYTPRYVEQSEEAELSSPMAG